MKKVFFNNLNYLLEIEKSMYKIVVDDPIVYRNISFNVLENITYSENNKIVDLEKHGLVIYDCFHINLREKRLVNALYKRLENSINDKGREFINTIENNCFKLFDEISDVSDITIDYLDTIEVSKLFSIFNVSFPFIHNDNYLELLANYFKICADFINIKIIVTFGLFSLLKKEELVLLEKELMNLELVLIDIECNAHDSIKNDLLIDSDWCII